MQRTLFTGIDSNVIISTLTTLIGLAQRQLYVKLNVSFSVATSICPKYYCTQFSCAKKQLWRNLVSANLKLKK